MRFTVGQVYKKIGMVHRFAVKRFLEMRSGRLPQDNTAQYRETVEDLLQNYDQRVAEGNGDEASIVFEALAKEDKLRLKAADAMRSVEAKKKSVEQKRADRRSFEGVAGLFAEGGGESG